MHVLRKNKVKNEIEHLSVVTEIIMKLVMTTSNDSFYSMNTISKLDQTSIFSI